MSIFAQVQPPPFEGYHISYVATYLRALGWRTQEYSQWIEFYGELDADGEPLMLVLPRDPNAREAKGYIAKAVGLLSALDDEPESLTAWRILNVHNDVFVVRNIETGHHSAISVRVADQQISELKHLIALGARAERDPRPYYENSSSSNRYIDRFRFGHTIRGSFALTIEAPIIQGMEIFESNYPPNQLPLIPDLQDYRVIQRVERPPEERRIVERLMRGLIAAQRAAIEDDVQPLVNEFGSGFNANMCESFVRMATNAGPIDYGVLWSPKIPIAKDLQGHSLVKLDKSAYDILREAARIMRHRQPEEERIRGIVTHFGSEVPPLSEGEEGREVIIDWLRGQGQRRASIVVPLKRDDYMLATDAHLRWATVEVTGKVVRSSSGYRLVDPRDFQVLN